MIGESNTIFDSFGFSSLCLVQKSLNHCLSRKIHSVVTLLQLVILTSLLFKGLETKHATVQWTIGLELSPVGNPIHGTPCFARARKGMKPNELLALKAMSFV